VECTCEWIVKHAKYLEWISQPSGLLWISGDASKGNSMLGLCLIEHLENLDDHAGSRQPLFFFCSSDQGKDTGTSIVRSLIYQLLDHVSWAYDHIAKPFERYGPRLFDDSRFEALWSVLTAIIRDKRFNPTPCILDGLDECNEDAMEVFWTKIGEIFSVFDGSPVTELDHRLQLMIISGNNPDSIERALRKLQCLRLEQDTNQNIKSDVTRYIQARLQELDCPVETCECISEMLVSQAEGTYSWCDLL
jgi:hypothetical protein